MSIAMNLKISLRNQKVKTKKMALMEKKMEEMEKKNKERDEILDKIINERQVMEKVINK